MNNQHKPLFSFGTLMDLDILSCVTNVPKGNLLVTPATLPGYKQRNVSGENFPVILADENSSTTGVLIDGLGAEDFERILFYEGNEYYLAPITVTDNKNTAVAACVFLSNDIYQTATQAWNFDTWQKSEKRDFLLRVQNYMQYFGKLSVEDADQHW